jgi:hypothetical protein
MSVVTNPDGARFEKQDRRVLAVGLFNLVAGLLHQVAHVDPQEGVIIDDERSADHRVRKRAWSVSSN